MDDDDYQSRRVIVINGETYCRLSRDHVDRSEVLQGVVQKARQAGEGQADRAKPCPLPAEFTAKAVRHWVALVAAHGVELRRSFTLSMTCVEIVDAAKVRPALCLGKGMRRAAEPCIERL
jgi:hypothetical protein